MPARGRSRLAAAALVAAALLAGCAVAPVVPRADRPIEGARAPTTKQVAQDLTVQGHRGRLTAAERQALLARIGAQGNATFLQRHLAAQSALQGIELSASNDARLLLDGPATFAAMFAAIERARASVHVESYIIEDVAVAQRLAALLSAKRAQGIDVAVIYDAVGSFGTPKDYFDGLRANGIGVCAFNPVNPLKRPSYWNITHRDHRKIVVVDREVAFIGGINISAAYSSGSFGRSRAAPRDRGDGWRDTQIELRGPAAAELDDLFRGTWSQQSCPGALAAALPPAPRRAGKHVVQVIPSAPSDDYNRIYAMLLAAIDTAQQSIHLTMAYFAPGEDMVDALADAAERGVDVQLVLPSVSDFAPVLYAGQSYYDRLLEAGVRIHELQNAVLHSKTVVIDGVVSSVGSSNLDWRSFSANNEVNAVVYGDDFGDAMQRMFQQDVAASHEIQLAEWRQRGPWARVRELAARAFEAWW